jgi:aspartate/methionine/tyrosine aminotransferase
VFPPARDALISAGASIQTLGLSFDEGYRLDPERLIAMLTPATRLVSLASPQNPSGVAVPQTVMTNVLAAMAARCPAAFLLVDETYRQAVYADDAPAPSAARLGPRVIVTGSLSKCHGAPGLRVGWAITQNRALREQLILGKFNTVIANSTIDEALALAVLRRADRIVGPRRTHLAAGRDRTAAWVARNAALVEWIRPNAGALCCVRLRRDRFDDAAVARFHAALARRDARVGSGTWFGEEANVFRVGFGLLSIPALDTALDVVGHALRDAQRAAA